MGNTDACAQQVFEENSWEEQSEPNGRQLDPKFTLLKHKYRKGVEAEKYSIFFTTQHECVSYIDSAVIRKKYEQFLASILHLEQEIKKGLFSTQFSAHIICERIPYRLSDIVNLSLS